MRNRLGLGRLAGAALVVACAATSAQEEAARAHEVVKLQVAKDTPVAAFLDAMARQLDAPLLYDPRNPRVAGRTLDNELALEVERGRLLDTVRSVLAFYELLVVPVGPRELRIHLVVDTRSTNQLVKGAATFVPFADLSKRAESDGDLIVTVIPVRNLSNLTNLRSALQHLVTPTGIGRIAEVADGSGLVVMDFARSVHAIAKTVEALDLVEPESAWVLEKVELRHARAETMAAALEALLARDPEAGDPRAPASERARRVVRVVAYPPRNALLLSGPAADCRRVRDLIASLDLPGE